MEEKRRQKRPSWRFLGERGERKEDKSEDKVENAKKKTGDAWLPDDD